MVIGRSSVLLMTGPRSSGHLNMIDPRDPILRSSVIVT